MTILAASPFRCPQWRELLLGGIGDGGKLIGQTCTSGKGYKIRYYVCANHHAGKTDICPSRYRILAEVVENHILGLIKSDLGRGNKFRQASAV